MADPTDKAREEFFSEAQELIETLSRSLLALDDQTKADGMHDPSLVNEAFRAVHTLKSLAGLFGAQVMSTLSHRLEDCLDELRLGRIDLDANVLDVLFQAVELYWQLLAAEREPGAATPSIDGLLARLGSSAAQRAVPDNALEQFELDVGLLSVLTEYEEHRLKTNIEQGRDLYRVRVQFELMTIDKELEDIKARLKAHGEVITYLPTGEASSPDVIELDLLLASGSNVMELETALEGINCGVESIPRRSTGAESTTINPPMPPGDAIEAGEERSVPARQAEGSVAPPAMMRSVSQTVRVDIRKLDGLMNIVGELALVRSALALLGDHVRTEGNRQLSAELYRIHRNFDRRLGELQGGILEVRMVPLGQVFDRLARVVRQISRDVGKEIRLVITGSDTEIDKLIVEELSDPLMHIVRNAIDHGIESKEERQAAGKPVAGTIALNAFQKGNHVVIEVEDDGGGVDEMGLIERAVRLGALERQQARDISREEALGLIFLPGVSTREQAGDYSGRGVGMDVVKTNIGKLGGIIDLQSEPQIGTKITITLPITLAIVSALLIRCARRVFALPLTSVSEAIVFDPSLVKVVDGKEVMTLRGASLPLCHLNQLFELEGEETNMRRFVVVAALGARRLGLVVDHLLGQQDIVIKPLGASLRGVKGFSGATELGDQRVALVIDAGGIIEEVLTTIDTREERVRTHA